MAKEPRHTEANILNNTCVVVRELAQDTDGKTDCCARLSCHIGALISLDSLNSRACDMKNRCEEQTTDLTVATCFLKGDHPGIDFVFSCRSDHPVDNVLARGNFYIPWRKFHNTCLPLCLSLVIAQP